MSEGFTERLDRQLAQDAEDVRDEVVLVLTREQAEDVRWALNQGLWLYDVTFPEGEYDRHEAIDALVGRMIAEKLGQ